MRAVLVIAASTVREHSRRRLLAFFAIASVVLSVVLVLAVRDTGGQMLFGPTVSIATVAALGVFQLLALVAALATSMGAIGQPFASGEVLAVLARPVAKWQYALARFAASIVVVAALNLLLAIETQAVQAIATGGVLAALWGHFAVLTFNLAVVVAFATVVSAMVSTPAIVAIAAFVVYQLAGTLATLHRLVELSRVRGPVSRLVEAAWYVTPKFLVSPLQTRQLQSPELGNVGELLPRNSRGLVLWAALYLLALVVAALALTERKDA